MFKVYVPVPPAPIAPVTDEEHRFQVDMALALERAVRLMSHERDVFVAALEALTDIKTAQAITRAAQDGEAPEVVASRLRSAQ